MSQYNIDFVASANFKQPIAQVEALQRVVEELNREMIQAVALNGKLTNPKAFSAMSSAVMQGSKTFRDAAASSGAFAAEQIRVNSATENYTKLLQKQKLTFREWARSMKTSRAAYQEQLMLQQMAVRQLPNTRGGKTYLDVIRPTEFSKDLDTARNRLGWFNEQLRSSSLQLVNWGKNTQWAGRQLMVGITLPIAALGAASGKLYYDMDKQLTRIQKVYNTTADQFSSSTQEQMRGQMELNNLRQQSTAVAVDAAKRYGAAIQDTLEVEADLAAAGLEGNNLLQSTTDVMKNAMLGEIEHQTAMKATIAMQQILHLSTKRTADMWAYMNAVENSTSLGMKDFAAAIPVALGPLKEMGGDVETLGLLLTGMVERGVTVGKAANAIKSSMQRLIRPSEQVREEFEALTGANIADIAQRNKGNLLGILKEIYNVTKDLDQYSKGKVYAGLFGAYQLANITAMVDSMGDLQDGIGQVTTAYNVSQMSASEWRQIQDREIRTWQQSVSGRFKRAIETLKAELATAGGVFLEIGVGIVDFLAKIVSAFNDLPKSTKKLFAIVAIATAIAGPLIMLTGLFANLVGNIMRVGTGIAGMLLKFEVLDKEGVAAKLVTDNLTKSLQAQASATERQTQLLQVMAAALFEAEQAQKRFMASQLASQGLPVPSNLLSPGVGGGKRSGPYDNTGTYSAPGRHMAEEVSEKSAKNAERLSKGMHSAATSGGLFAAAMVASMVSSNETVDNVANMAMIASIAAPALVAIWSVARVAAWGSAVGKVTGFFMSRWVAIKALVITTSAQMAMMPSVMAATAVGVRGLGAALAATLGPIGLMIAGFTAAFLAIKKIREEANKAGNDVRKMYDNAEPLADIYGYTYQETAELKPDDNKAAQQASNVRKIANEYSGLVQNIRNANDAQAKYNEAIRLGVQVLSSGGTVEQAKEATRDALMAADNLTSKEANRIMLRFGFAKDDVTWAVNSALTAANDAMGSAMDSMNPEVAERFWRGMTDWKSYVPFGLAGDAGTVGEISNEAMAQMEAMGKNLSVALNEGMKQGDISGFTDTFTRGLNTIDQKIRDSSGDTQKRFKAMRVAMIRSMASAQGLGKYFEKYPDDLLAGQSSLQIMEKLLIKLTAAQKLAIWQSQEQKGVWGGIQGIGYGVAAAAEAAADAVKDTSNNLDGAASAARRAASGAITFAQALKAAKQIDLKSLFKDNMSGIQQSIADNTMSNFESSMDRALDAVRASGQARLDAFDRRADAASAAMDRRFENRENHINAMYDKRIKAVQREIDAEQRADEIRQRLFDAEMARMDRLNEAANRNIDFNTALTTGNFDEAAKIRNDAEADQFDFDLQRQLDNADRKSERRQKRLEKRIDTLEELRDKALENLQRIEEAEKAQLQRSQERKRKALEAEVKANEDAAQRMWEDRRDFLEKGLDDFTGYTAMSSRDLLRHMNIWEGKYGEFDLSTERMFNRTVDDINRYMRTEMSKNRRNIMNEQLWEVMGNRIAAKMIRGAFGMSKGGFFKWLAGKGPGPSNKAGGGAPRGPTTGAGQTHSGGGHSVDGGFASGGVLPGFSPGRDIHHFSGPAGRLHLSGGEAIMRPEWTKAVGGPGAVSQMNKAATRGDDPLGRGVMDGDQGKKGILGGAGYQSSSAFMAAAVYRMTASLIEKQIKDAGAAAQARDLQAMVAGLFMAAKPGNYGGRVYGAEQLRNAATIASVGSKMGMSVRDLEIGIMTAITESGLVNVRYGDRDSQGLFQQRPSQGWGTVAQVTNPEYAARKFFEALRGVANRGSMSPWLAAQAVQRSAFSDGSNYLPYWDDAMGIFRAMGRRSAGGTGGGFVSGPGGKHRPVKGGSPGGIHDSYTGFPAVDIGVPVGTPVYAVGNGVISRSQDLRGNDGRVSNGGYYSYGRVMQLKLDSGPEVLYAHLNSRAAAAGKRVTGGSIIARSGNTGHSFGPHLHFGARGASPYAWLKTGGEILADGVPAILHKKETVLTAPLSQNLKDGIEQMPNFDALINAQNQLISSLRAIIDLNNSPYPPNSGGGTGGGTGGGNNGGGNNNGGNENPDTGGRYTVRTGAYNVWREASNAGTKKDLLNLMGRSNILSLNEMLNKKKALIPWIRKQGWGYVGNKGRANDTALIWNQNKYSLEKDGIKWLNPNHHRTGWGRNRAATYGQFKDKETNRKFWQISAHTAGYAQRGNPWWRNIMREQYNSLGSLISNLKKTGQPVFLAGDLNTRTTGRVGNPNIKFPFRGMKDIKAFRMSLDRIFFGGANLLGAQKIDDRRTSSDHPALLAQFGIPAMRRGGFTMSDGLALLHKKELVLSPDKTRELYAGIEKLEMGGRSEYTVNMVFTGDPNNKSELKQFILNTMKEAERRKPTRRVNE